MSPIENFCHYFAQFGAYGDTGDWQGWPQKY